jgi:hypothetical protein
MSWGVDGKGQDKIAGQRSTMHLGHREPRKRFWSSVASPHAVLAAMLWIMWMVWIPHDSGAQTAPDKPQEPLPSGVSIQIAAKPKAGTVGDPIQLDLEVTTPPGYQVEILKPVPESGDFAILDFLPEAAGGETEKLQNPTQAQSLQQHHARIVTAIYKTGKFVFPAIRIQMKTPEGKDIILSSPPVDIEIQSVLTDTNPRLKDLKKQAEISEPVHWALWLTIALAALVLGTIIQRYWRRRRHRPVAFSPEQTQDQLDLAEADLRDLLERGLPEKGMEKQFYVLLSEIVKRILESGYAIHTAEKTTAEIMHSLNRDSALELQSKGLIEFFLLRCDVVKFAKYVPSKIEHEEVSKDAMQILAQVRKAVAGRQSAVGSEQLVVGSSE